jgi:CBS domain-containing protein
MIHANSITVRLIASKANAMRDAARGLAFQATRATTIRATVKIIIVQPGATQECDSTATTPDAPPQAMTFIPTRDEASGTVRREQTQDDYGRRRDVEARGNMDARNNERDAPRSGERSGASRSHVRCRDIMTRDVTVAHRDTPVHLIAQMMRDEDTGVIPVVEGTDISTAATDASAPASELDNANEISNASQASSESDTSSLNEMPPASSDTARARRGERAYGKLAGLITDRDIVVRAVAENKTDLRADEIMTTDVHTAEPNDRVIDAIRKMGDKQVRRIPVCDRDGNLRGIISMADVALETEEDRELAHALEEISSGKSFWSRMFG